MKPLVIVVLLLLIKNGACAYLPADTTLLQLSEDNDFFNVWLKGTDEAYTHGFRASLHYSKSKPSSFIFDRWVRHAIKGDREDFSWSLMQTMITPKNLTSELPANHDYRYACSMMVWRSYSAYNSKKQVHVSTELLAGILGPAAMGRQTQESFHRLIKSQTPMGWNYQYSNTLLLNINIGLEKQLWSPFRFFEIIGTVNASAGTSLTALSLSTMMRLGKLNPYFHGTMHRYTSMSSDNWQIYFTAAPSIDWVAYNAHIQGNIVNAVFDNEDTNSTRWEGAPTQRTLNHHGVALCYGIVMGYKRVTLSFQQQNRYAMINEQKRHLVGNVSVFVLMN